MRGNMLASTISKREDLFGVVTKMEPNLILAEKSDQIRNLVHKAKFEGQDSFVKIGLRDNLGRQLKFYQNAPSFKSFQTPKLLSSGELEFEGREFIYLIEKQIQGESLYATRKFDLINDKIVDIVIEIDHYPDTNLEIPERKKRFKDADELKKYKNRQSEMLSTWYEKSLIKYSTILNSVILTIENTEVGVDYPLGPVHGELNTHHIFSDNKDNISIIDWETFYCAGLRFYDLQEYLGRLLVFEGQFENIQTIMKKFQNKQEFDHEFFKYGFFQKILGSIYEASADSITPKISQNQEKEIVDFVEEICN